MRFESKSVDDHFRACLILASVNDIELADHSCDLQLMRVTVNKQLCCLPRRDNVGVINN